MGLPSLVPTLTPSDRRPGEVAGVRAVVPAAVGSSCLRPLSLTLRSSQALRSSSRRSDRMPCTARASESTAGCRELGTTGIDPRVQVEGAGRYLWSQGDGALGRSRSRVAWACRGREGGDPVARGIGTRRCRSTARPTEICRWARQRPLHVPGEPWPGAALGVADRPRRTPRRGRTRPPRSPHRRRRPDAKRTSRRRTRRRRTVQRRDRRAPVHHPQDHRAPPRRHLPQAGHHLAPPAPGATRAGRRRPRDSR